MQTASALFGNMMFLEMELVTHLIEFVLRKVYQVCPLNMMLQSMKDTHGYPEVWIVMR